MHIILYKQLLNKIVIATIHVINNIPHLHILKFFMYMSYNKLIVLLSPRFAHIPILARLPNFHLKSSHIIISKENMLCQIKDELCPAPIKSPIGKYLALKIHDEKAFGQK